MEKTSSSWPHATGVTVMAELRKTTPRTGGVLLDSTMKTSKGVVRTTATEVTLILKFDHG